MIPFIRLHSVDDNSPAIFAVDKILDAAICEYNDKGNYTTLDFMEGDNEFVVNESIDKMFALLKDSGFVRVHRKVDNTLAIFNIDGFIMAVVDEDGSNTIVLTNGIEIAVNETPEKIYNLVRDAYNVKHGIAVPEKK